MSRKDSKLATKLQGEGNQFKSTQRDAVLDFTLNLKDFLIKFEFQTMKLNTLETTVSGNKFDIAVIQACTSAVDN